VAANLLSPQADKVMHILGSFLPFQKQDIVGLALIPDNDVLFERQKWIQSNKAAALLLCRKCNRAL
jgi:hypothetical protein